MAADEQPDLLVLETESSMVPLTGSQIPTTRIAHFLLPTANAADPDPQPPPLPPPCKPISDPQGLIFKGWSSHHTNFLNWVSKLSPIYGPLWHKSGIAAAIQASTYAVRRDLSSLSGVLHLWNPNTNTFHFRWSEATVTLEDIMVLGGFSVLGEPIREHRPLSPELEKLEITMATERARVIKGAKSTKADPSTWTKHFMQGNADEVEHIAFLSLWLTKFVFPERVVRRSVFPLAIRLAQGTRIALAPAVLACLYRDMSAIANTGSSTLAVWAPFRILQLWVWERFVSLRPERQNYVNGDEPRAARWHDVGRKADPALVELVLKSPNQFQWRPYTIGCDGWRIPGFYKEEGGWLCGDEGSEELRSFARCLRACELVGVDCVEHYLPHRVAMQFGLDQDIPGSVARANSSWEAAWETYDISQKKVKFYVPPRIFESDVSKRYSVWWTQYMKNVKGSGKKKKKRKLEDVCGPAVPGSSKPSLKLKLSLKSTAKYWKGLNNSRQPNGKGVDDALVTKNSGIEKGARKMKTNDSSCVSINVGTLSNQAQSVEEANKSTIMLDKELDLDLTFKRVEEEITVDNTLIPKDSDFEITEASDSTYDSINVAETEGILRRQDQITKETGKNTNWVDEESERDIEIARLKEEISAIKAKILDLESQLTEPEVFLMLAGSAGGGGPPHGHPPRLTTYSEAGPAADIPDDDPDDDEPMPSSDHKKGRSKALGKEIIQRVHQHGPITLRWERDRRSWKALGHEGQLYYSGVGIQVRDNCDPSFGKWEDVPSNQKDQTFRKLADWFVLDFNNSTIRDVVNRDSGLRYKEWKNTLHYYFKKRGGTSNLANVRARLPDTIRDPVQWERCIERFCSEAFQKRSKKNSENRQKLTYGGRHGRVSMAEHIDQSVDPETQEPKSLIQNWEDLHRRPDGTWTHETAEARVIAMRERATQAMSSGKHADDVTIVQDILGRSRGFMTGIGPALTGSSSRASEPSIGTSYGTSQGATEKWDADRKELLACTNKSDKKAKKFDSKVRKLMAFISKQFPGAQMPDTPPDSDNSDGGDVDLDA